MTWSALWSILAVLLLASTTAVAAPLADDATGVIRSKLPAELAGAVTVQSTMGAVLATSGVDLREATLHAESLSIEFAFQAGVKARDEPGLFGYITDRGEDRIDLTDAEVDFGDFEGPSFLLGFTDETPADFLVQAPQSLTIRPTSDLLMTQVGTRPGVTSAGDAPDLGFWYTQPGPVVQGDGAAAMSLQGSFTVFPHNTTITATATERTWTNWTGYRESDGPVQEFELRVTKLHVENGLLMLPVHEAIRLAMPALDVTLDGLAAFPAVTGRLPVPDGLLLFDEDPATLSGEGQMRVEAREQAMSVQPSGGLAVSSSDATLQAPSPTKGPSLWLIVVLALIAFGISGEFWFLPGRGARWMRRGSRAAAAGRWSLAAWCYGVATRARSADPLAWYERAAAEFEAGHPQQADQVAQRAADVPGIDTADLLELRASIAWQTGDEAGFGRLLQELAEVSPEMARGLAEDLAVDLDRVAPRLHKRLSERADREALDGYA